MTRIRIIKKEKKPTFVEQLEARARALVKDANHHSDCRSVESALEQELALVVSHIESVRNVHNNLRRNLLRHECYLSTEILQREPPEPVYDDPRLSERDRLRDRLRDVDKERRRLALQEDETMRGLQDQLLQAVNRSGHLGMRLRRESRPPRWADTGQRYGRSRVNT